MKTHTYKDYTVISYGRGVWVVYLRGPNPLAALLQDIQEVAGMDRHALAHGAVAFWIMGYLSKGVGDR